MYNINIKDVFSKSKRTIPFFVCFLKEFQYVIYEKDYKVGKQYLPNWFFSETSHQWRLRNEDETITRTKTKKKTEPKRINKVTKHSKRVEQILFIFKRDSVPSSRLSKFMSKFFFQTYNRVGLVVLVFISNHFSEFWSNLEWGSRE